MAFFNLQFEKTEFVTFLTYIFEAMAEKNVDKIPNRALYHKFLARCEFWVSVAFGSVWIFA
jgi:hypothetical protein